MNTHDLPTYTRPLHEDEDKCKTMLSSVKTSVSLQILQAAIPGAGTGLFSSSKIAAGEEIFRVENPIVNCGETSMLESTCDFCFFNATSSIHPSGRFATAADTPTLVSKCAGCKVVSYCSKVSQRSSRTMPIGLFYLL